MKKLNLKYPVIVEGKYDKIKLSNVISSPIITVGGFSILNDKKKRKYLSSLAEKTKLIILTDSDKAGGFIRSRLKGIVKTQQLINIYIPQIKGKEKRKNTPSAENLLGVEGMNAELLFSLLSPYEEEEKNFEKITSSDFYNAGLSGKSGSTEKRSLLAKRLMLPDNLSPKALIDAINSMGGKDLFISEINALEEEISKNTNKT